MLVFLFFCDCKVNCLIQLPCFWDAIVTKDLNKRIDVKMDTFIFYVSFLHLLACYIVFLNLCDFNFVLQLENDLDSYDLFE